MLCVSLELGGMKFFLQYTIYTKRALTIEEKHPKEKTIKI